MAWGGSGWNVTIPSSFILWSNWHLMQLRTLVWLQYLSHLDDIVAFVAHLPVFVWSQLFKLGLLLALWTDTSDFRRLNLLWQSWLISVNQTPSIIMTIWHCQRRSWVLFLIAFFFSLLLVHASLAKMSLILDPHDPAWSALWLATEAKLGILQIEFGRAILAERISQLSVTISFAPNTESIPRIYWLSAMRALFTLIRVGLSLLLP